MLIFWLPSSSFYGKMHINLFWRVRKLFLISAFIIILHNSLFICSSERHASESVVMNWCIWYYIFYLLVAVSIRSGCDRLKFPGECEEICTGLFLYMMSIYRPIYMCSHLITPSLSIIITSIPSFCMYFWFPVWQDCWGKCQRLKIHCYCDISRDFLILLADSIL